MGLPPGPRVPPVGQTLAWIVRPEPFMARAHARFGDVFTVRLAAVGTLVFVADPALLKPIFTADADVLRAGEANSALEPVMGARSVLLLDGDEHLRARRLMLPPFHGERLATYESLIAAIADEALDAWPRGVPFRLQERMQAITLDVIARVVFGVEEPARLAAVREALKALVAMSTRRVVMLPWLRRDLGPSSPWRRFLALRNHVDGVIYDEIARRRRAPDLGEREDILSLLLAARDEQGVGLSDRELRDELVTLLLAGHETTATALAWTFERLLRAPDALERLTAECRDADGDGGYLEAVALETLRLHPPLPLVARMVARPWELPGVGELPAGVMVAPCIWLVHRRADLYPEPDAFRPERFLGRAPATYEWLPFGGGRRRCLGATFASFEMQVVLRTLLRRADLRVRDPRPEGMRRRAIVFAPGRGAEAVLVRRRPRLAAPRALGAPAA
jgi:cytochrome P450 family 135